MKSERPKATPRCGVTRAENAKSHPTLSEGHLIQWVIGPMAKSPFVGLLPTLEVHGKGHPITTDLPKRCKLTEGGGVAEQNRQPDL